MTTLPEPDFDPIETRSSADDPFYGSLVVDTGSRQSFMVTVENFKLDEATVTEIEQGIQRVVAEALAGFAFDVKPLDQQAIAGIGGGLAGRQFVARSGLISELLPDTH